MKKKKKNRMNRMKYLKEINKSNKKKICLKIHVHGKNLRKQKMGTNSQNLNKPMNIYNGKHNLMLLKVPKENHKTNLLLLFLL